MIPQLTILYLTLVLSTHQWLPSSATESKSIYEILRSKGLPMGLLPKGVSNFTLDETGKFVVFLDQECNAKYENQIHYNLNITGTLSYGQIASLSGVSAQDLFLWFPVKEIRVDVPSSGLIYFDVGVIFKQFSLSLFETPRDCTAANLPGKNFNRKIRHELDHDKSLRSVL